MKLYHHYKRKPYKYIGLARHSETLEEMVIYETRYENANGKVWVRPKDMFFESVEVSGQTIPRFKKIPLQLIETTQVTDADIKTLASLVKESFGEWDSDSFHSKLKEHPKLYLVTAFIEGQAVGFKLGYELKAHEFYSWLGGVIPEYRGLGIASALMEHQHEWCRKEGYGKIQTKTQNRFREMLILNLKYGFEIISSYHSDESGLKVILEKTLK